MCLLIYSGLEYSLYLELQVVKSQRVIIVYDFLLDFVKEIALQLYRCN